MSHLSIQQKIDNLFDDAASSPQELSQFVSALRDAHSEAETRFNRSLLMLIIGWALFYLIVRGFVIEGQVMSFKLSKLADLAIVAPVVTGGLSYMFFGAFAMWTYQKLALSACYRRLLPKAIDEVHRLLLKPSFLTIEEVFAITSRSSFLAIANVLGIFISFSFLLCLPVAAVVHSSYLILSPSRCAWYWNALSIFVGALLLIRGGTLFAAAQSAITRVELDGAT